MMTAAQQNSMNPGGELSSFDVKSIEAKNTELWQCIGAIADNGALMRRLARYAKRLVKEKEDPTLMTKEDFFARVDEAKKGPSYELQDGETIEDLLKRVE